ncbi:MAG: insulinase family protein [Candidatus Aminicenantes bacterium]|nr:insulinase family protein [Candidatus Aminicenantes bacterium]
MKKTVLKSGLTVLTEKYSQIPSFALSYTVKSGSCNETVSNNGLHHLIEHMLFKGSSKYSQRDIADISDRLGGRMNAFTSREITQYYIKSIDEKFSESFDLLTDIVFNSNFDKTEFTKEKDVISQEIKEGDDNPDSKAFELFYRKVFGDSGVGLPIAGTLESVSGLKRNFVDKKYRELYIPSNIILSCVGNIDHEEILILAEEKFADSSPSHLLEIMNTGQSFNSGVSVHSNKSLKQVYSVIGFNSIPITSSERYKYMILNDILGAGMSSRLFQKIREEKGLAYTIGSFIDSYKKFGVHMIYAITDPGKTNDYIDAVKEELKVLKKSGINPEELKKSKDHIKTSIILSLENNVSKMRFNVSGDIYFGEQRSLENIIEEINMVKIDDINVILNDYPDFSEAMTLFYGDISKKDLPSVNLNK